MPKCGCDREMQAAAFQVTGNAYQQTLRLLGIECSMSRTGCCYDNAAMERFFWSLKHEWTNHRTYTDLRRRSTERVQIHRNLLQSRATSPDARLPVTQPIRSRTRPGTSGVICPPPESAVPGLHAASEVLKRLPKGPQLRLRTAVASGQQQAEGAQCGEGQRAGLRNGSCS